MNLRRAKGHMQVVRVLTILLMVVSPVYGLGVKEALAQTDAQLVEQFFPQALVDESQARFDRGGPPPFRTSAFKAADLNGSGTAEFLIAGYTNGFSATIRVLRKANNTASLVAEPNLPLLGGVDSQVELLDLDGDGRPEIIISFSSARGNWANWVFKWTGTTLNLMGPSGVDEEGDVSTLLANADFEDLDRDGKLEAINPPELSAPEIRNTAQDINKFEVFKLTNGQYTLMTTLNFFGTFVLQPNLSPVQSHDFAVERTDIAYLVKILNGDSTGLHRVDNAVVTLNGMIIASPERFGQTVAEINILVLLQQMNTLSVELRSPVRGELTVLVEPQPAGPNITIGDYTLISSVRFSRTLFDYTYKAKATNAGPGGAQGVTATVASRSAATTVVEGSLTFGDVGAGQVVTSSDTFTIRQDRTVPFNPTNLVWTVFVQ